LSKNNLIFQVLLDFIDEKKLLIAESYHCPATGLTPNEKFRNSFGNVLTHTFDPNVTDTYPSCNPEIGLPDILSCQSLVISSFPKLSPGAYFTPTLGNFYVSSHNYY
jgi:5'-3' exonuclease